MFKLKGSKLTSMFTGFGNGNPKSQNDAEGGDRVRPPTPRKDTPHKRNNSSFLNMSNPFENIKERGRAESPSQSPYEQDEKIQQQPMENLLDRSVKISFPKKSDVNGNTITEAMLREKVSKFGQIINVGMKEKLAVVLFASSAQALTFCAFHDNALGADYKMKYMGTKAMSDEELQRHWQQQQRQEQRAPSQEQNMSNSTAQPDPTAPSSLAPVPSPPHPHSTTAIDRRSSLGFGSLQVDAYPSIRSQTRCGSETESDTEEYGKGTGSGRDRGDRSRAGSAVAESPRVPTLAPTRTNDWQGGGPSERSGTSGQGSGSGPGGSTSSVSEWPKAVKRVRSVLVPEPIQMEDIEEMDMETSRSVYAPVPLKGQALDVGSNREGGVGSVAKGQRDAPERNVTGPLTPSSPPLPTQATASIVRRESVPAAAVPVQVPEKAISDAWKSAKVTSSPKSSAPAQEEEDSDSDSELPLYGQTFTSDAPHDYASDGFSEDDNDHRYSRGPMTGVDAGRQRRESFAPTQIQQAQGGRAGQRQGEEGPHQSSSFSHTAVDSRPPDPTAREERSVLRGAGEGDRGASMSRSNTDEGSTGRHHEANDDRAAMLVDRSSPIMVSVQRSPLRMLSAESARVLPSRVEPFIPVNRVESEVVKIEGTMSQRNQDKIAHVPLISDSNWRLRARGLGRGADTVVGAASQQQQQQLAPQSSGRERDRDMDRGPRSRSLDRNTDRDRDRDRGRGRLQVDTQEAESAYEEHPAEGRRKESQARAEMVQMQAVLHGLHAANSEMQRDLAAQTKRVLMLESEALVRCIERGESESSLQSSQQLWALQLTAQTLRGMALDQENKKLREQLEASKIANTVGDAKIASLMEFLRTAKTDVKRLERESFGIGIDGNNISTLCGDTDAVGREPADCQVKQRGGHDVAARPAVSVVGRSEGNETRSDSDSSSDSENAKKKSRAQAATDAGETAHASALSRAKRLASSTPRGDKQRSSSVLPSRVSESLLQDLLATRKQIQSLSQMTFAAPISAHSAPSSSSRWGGGYEQEPRPNQRGRYDQNLDTSNLRSIGTGHYFESKEGGRGAYPYGAERAPSQSSGSERDCYYPAPLPVHLYPTAKPATDRRVLVHSPAPPPLMTYYGGLVPSKCSNTRPPPPPSSKSGKRREYLARLQAGD